MPGILRRLQGFGPGDPCLQQLAGRLLSDETRGRLTKLAPVFLLQLDMMFLRSGLDTFPRGIALRLSHAFHLFEAGDGVAHVSSVMNGFLAFLWEREILIGNVIAAGFIDLGHTNKVAT
jgi:hypothetical protein